MKNLLVKIGKQSKKAFLSQIHSNKKILGNGNFILANFLILFIHGVIGPTFIGVLLFGSVAIFMLD